MDSVDVIPESITSIKYALRDFVVGLFKKSEITSSIFLSLLFKNWKSKVDKMNDAVLASKAKTQQFTEAEFLTGLGI